MALKSLFIGLFGQSTKAEVPAVLTPNQHANVERADLPAAPSSHRPTPIREWARGAVPVLTVLLLLVSLRSVDVWRPVDGSSGGRWREPDVAGIARNFYVEGMNIFYPRIDWRGDGPGFVESEFPLYPWTVACLYRAVGYREELARAVSFALTLATYAYVYLLARIWLGRLAAVIALTFFGLNPLSARLATAIQPEPLMTLCYAAGAFHFLRWCQLQVRFHYWLALTFVTLAILAKLPAVHIGILLALVSLQTFGKAAVRRRDLWGFAVVSLAVSVGWYWHARELWLQYGNSLGMSNEAYLRITSGSFLKALKTTVAGNLSTEISSVFTVPGVLLAGGGLVWAARDRGRWPLLYWAAALAASYVVTGRTTGEPWASYYHIVSVVPAAVFVAGGCSLVLDQSGPGRERRSAIGSLGVRAATTVMILCLAGTLALSTRAAYQPVQSSDNWSMYECTKVFRTHIPPNALTVASAPNEFDQYGLTRAYNAPYMFFWTRTKGFSLPDDMQNLAKLEEFRARGARYFLAERRSLSTKPGFEAEIRRRYHVDAECGGNALVSFETNPKDGGPGSVPSGRSR